MPAQNLFEVDLGKTTFIPGFCAFLLYDNGFGVSLPLPHTDATHSHQLLLGMAQWPSLDWAWSLLADAERLNEAVIDQIIVFREPAL